MKNDIKEAFLGLLKLGLSHRSEPLQVCGNWNEIRVLSERQGLSAVVLDGIECLPEIKRPSKEALLEWIGEVLQGYEYRYEHYRRAIGELAGFYNDHGFKMMVLKGYASSLDWPNPKHRPCGDIDIWLFGKQKETDALLVKEKGFKVDTSHHHHTVFDWCGFSVENHYDFVNVYAHKSSAVLEKVFKELGADDSHFVEVLGFPVDIFPAVKIVRELKERVLEDILDPEYTAAEPKGFFPRVIYKYKRWQGNAWKQKMCYNESRWKYFWLGIWAKILKPTSI